MKTKTIGLFLADKEYYVAADSMEDAVRVFKAQTAGETIGSIETVCTVVVEDQSPAVVTGEEIRHRFVHTNRGERLIACLEKMREEFVRVKPEETFEVEDLPSDLSLEDAMKERVKAALEKAEGNRKIAADMLGVSERSIYRWIKQFGL